MSLALKVNFKKGWPNPSILEAVAPGVAGLEAGMVGRKHPTTGAWVLGITGINDLPFVFRNSFGDPDAARGPGIGADTANQGTWNQVAFGGIQGIALSNPIEVETVQFNPLAAPAVGNALSVGTNGKFKIAVATEIIVAVCTEASHGYQGANFITFIPVAPRVA